MTNFTTILKKAFNLRKRHFFFLCLFLCVLVFVSFVVYYHYTYCAIDRFYADYTVASYSAFNLDADKIHFGTFTPGGFGERALTLHSACHAHVSVFIYGLPYLSASEPSFDLLLGEEKSLLLRVNVPLDAKQKTYEGRIILFFKRL